MRPSSIITTYWASVTVILLVLMSGCSREDSNRPPAATGSPGYSAQQTGSSRCLCSPGSAKDLGYILYSANPLSELDANKWAQFRNNIESNARHLTPGSPIITCARRLGSAFVNQGITSYSRQDYNDAYSSVLSMGGSMDQAQGVADSMMSGSVDAFMMGKELLWLADVLPTASQGNWQRYTTTGTQSRNQVREVLRIYKMMPDMAATLREMQPVLDQFGPMVQDQMVMASCLLAR